MKRKESFLGTGWNFPPTFDTRTGSIVMVDDADDIKQSLHILLSTRQGERVMRPDFGCDLNAMMFESLDASTINHIKQMIEDAILNYEPRITLEDLSIEPRYNEGIINITLTYTIRLTNTRTNLVYPFYRTEGTEVRAVME